MAAESIIGVVAEEAVGGCINQIKKQFNYLAHYHDNMENLNTKLQNLESKRNEVQVKVSSATDKGETIMDNVQKWIGEVGAKMEEAEDILKGKEKVGNGCWRGWILNFKLRYSLSRKAMKKSADLDTFLPRGVFEIVAHPIRPLAHVHDSAGASSSKTMNKDIQGNEESKEGATSDMHAAGVDGGLTSRSDKVMAAVRDPKIRIIRICGRAGIGKSTIAKQVEQRARAERLFHEIAMIEVNQNPDHRILQLHIAELLGLKFVEDAVPARAKQLYQRLNANDEKGENKKILLILDNVWRKKDLENVGIPLTDEKSFCKILLTSRSDLVCKDITPEPAFNIDSLSDSESLVLFRQHIPKDSFYDQKMAEEFVKACGGLPISITSIAGAVAGKEEKSWTVALRKLQKSEIKGEFAEVFNSLKVSYDFLESEEIKSFFRLFCFFRKGSDVPIEYLARYGMALGCFPGPDKKLYESRSEAHSYADTLLHSSLLLRGGKAGCFKVHDIVWDFAVKVPSKDLFMVNHGDGLITSPTTDSYKNYTSISLPCSEMVEVLEGVDFRSLKFLQLIGNFFTPPSNSQNNFFEEMNELNVLSFRSLKVPSLPKSPKFLNNLLSLSFDGCSIDSDISIIGNLVKLEMLSFAYSNIKELPIQIANLKALRLLDMTGCEELHVIQGDVLSKLSSLEELYMRGTPLQLWSGSPMFFSDKKFMSKLVVLHITMPPVEVPRMDSLFLKLQYFKISVSASGRGKKDEFLSENYLDLECDSTVLQQPGVKSLLEKTGRMDLERITNLKNLEVNFSKLKNLSIKSCNEMEYLINMIGYPDQINVFGNLVSLRLFKLPRLVEIFHVCRSYSESSVAPFCNLKVLNVEECDELEHLFSASDARSLNKLEVIEVKSCDKLKVVFGKGRHGGDNVELSNLKKMTLEILPNLVGFCSDVDAPEFPQLEELEIWGLPLITSIIHQESDDSSNHPLFRFKGRPTTCKFQNLQSLTVRSCDSLRHLSTTSIAISFQELQNLYVLSCKSLITVIAVEGTKEEKEKKCAREVMLFPKLNILSLLYLENLSTFSPKGYTLTWSSLKRLTLKECGGERNTLFPKLSLTSLKELCLENQNIPSGFWYDYFPRGLSYELKELYVKSSENSIIMFPPNTVREFQHLTSIHVRDCKSIEVVFDREEECNVGEVGSKLPTLNKLEYLEIYNLPKMVNVWKKVPQNFQGFCNLTMLRVYGCKSLRYLFIPSIAKCLVKLKEIMINNCELMEEVVSMRDKEGELIDEDIILFPQLQELVLTDLPSLESTRARDNVNATNISTSNLISDQESSDRTSPALVRLQGIVCSWRWSFHKLKTIDVFECKNLLYIFPPNTIVKLPALEKIRIQDCESLQYIFSSSMATSLEQLTELRVEGCEMMTEVIQSDEEAVDKRIKSVNDPTSPPLVTFHKLKSIGVYRCNNLSSIFPPNIVVRLPSLERITGYNCKSLEYIFSSSMATSLQQLKSAEMEGCNNLSSIFPANRLVQLPALESLIVKGCKSLKYILSSSTATSLQQLNYLRVEGCEMMTEVIQNDEEAVDERIKSIDDPTSPTLVSFHKLKSIEMEGCNNLSFIFSPNRLVRLPALETLSVEDCKSLQYIFSSSTARSLEQLTDLTVQRCEIMKVIIKNEEAVDETIKVVLYSLDSLKLKTLPNLEGICLGMVSFGWPLLTSLDIKYCWKMRIFTSGYSATPLLNHLKVHGKLYDPTVEKEDVNTILRNAHLNVDEYLDLKEHGTLTITDFHLAGDHLITHYTRWSWESIYVDDDIVEQYLIARNLPCLTKPRRNEVDSSDEDEEDDEDDEEDDDDDDDKVDHGDDNGRDEMNIYKPRTYDVSITYDQTYRTSRLWLKGYDESKADLPLNLIFEDINMKYLLFKFLVSIKDHPYESGPYTSLFPRDECSIGAKRVFNHLHEKGFDPKVQNHLQLFVDFLFPTIQFGPAP